MQETERGNPDGRRTARALRRTEFPLACKIPSGPIETRLQSAIERRVRIRKIADTNSTIQEAPIVRRATIATRSNERWFVDLIDYTNSPDGKFNYVLLAIGVFSRHAFARPLRDKNRRRSRVLLDNSWRNTGRRRKSTPMQHSNKPKRSKRT